MHVDVALGRCVGRGRGVGQEDLRDDAGVPLGSPPRGQREAVELVGPDDPGECQLPVLDGGVVVDGQVEGHIELVLMVTVYVGHTVATRAGTVVGAAAITAQGHRGRAGDEQ